MPQEWDAHLPCINFSNFFVQNVPLFLHIIYFWHETFTFMVLYIFNVHGRAFLYTTHVFL